LATPAPAAAATSPAAVEMFHDFLLAADAQSKTMGDPIPWKDYDGILVVHAGSDLQSDVLQDSPLDIPTFTLGSQSLWNLIMAFSLVAMLPPVILFIILRRYMVRGLSLGVVKG
jgi:hypothetical protein